MAAKVTPYVHHDIASEAPLSVTTKLLLHTQKNSIPRAEIRSREHQRGNPDASHARAARATAKKRGGELHRTKAATATQKALSQERVGLHSTGGDQSTAQAKNKGNITLALSQERVYASSTIREADGTLGDKQTDVAKAVADKEIRRTPGKDDETREVPDNSKEPAAVPMRKTRTLPGNLSAAGRRMSATNYHTNDQKRPAGRFNQFRRASAVFLEELIHLHKPENNKSAALNHKRGSLKRRLSLTDLFQRKSSGRHESEDSLDEVGGTEYKDYLNESICVWFADAFDEAQEMDKVESIFQSHGTSRSNYFTSSFGTKGSGKGEFQDIKDVTVLHGDRVLLTDWILGRVNLCQRNGRLLLTYTGTSFAEPWASVDLGDKQIAVTSRKDHCVGIFSIEGEIIDSFGENFFEFPAGIAVDRDGHLVVCDAKTDKVSMHDKTGLFIRYIGNADDSQQKFKTPRYACVLQTGEIVVSDSGNHKIKLFSPTGNFLSSFGGYGSGTGQMKFPYGICANGRGDIFVADHYNNRITLFSRDGTFLRHLLTFDHGLRRPQALAMGPDMKLYVSHGKLKASEVLIFDLKTR